MPFPDIALCRTGYSRNFSGEQKRNDFDSHCRCRRLTRRRGVTDTGCWVCTAEQCQTLEAFHRQAGGRWFTIALPDYTGLTETTARFNSPLTIARVVDNFEVTASLYVPAPAIIPKDELDDWLLRLIGVTDDTFGLPIHYWANTGWHLCWVTGINDDQFGAPIHRFLHTGWPHYWRAP